MSERDRKHWDEKYRAKRGDPSKPLASVRWIPRADRACDAALDLACGSGRHVESISAKGYRVLAADASIVALRDLVSTEVALPTKVDRVLFDSDEWPFAERAFALIVQTDFLARAIFSSMKASVRAGGSILIDTFAGDGGPGIPGPASRAYRLRAGELCETFCDWEILHQERGPHREAILARKPART